MPLLHEVKNRCAQQVLAYDRCLAQYSSQGDEVLEKNCTPRLKDLWLCTERVKREAEERGNESIQRSKSQGQAALSEGPK